ncbi:putative ribonuclease H-like domain-containing protein [Tanacetum coccineum]
MALPPREQIHRFLRYEGLEYTDSDIADFESRLERIYTREIRRVKVVDFQGMPKLLRDDLFAKIAMEHRDEAGVVVFTSQAWGRLFGTRGPLICELILEFLSTLRFGEEMIELEAVYSGLGITHREEMESLGFARDPVLRLCHRMMAHSIAGRSQASEKVTVTDLLYLRGLDVRSFIARLARHFGLLVAEILGGLTVIAPELPIIDMAELVRLQIYVQFDDTWAWVAMGPERQPDATAGTSAIAEDASAVDEGDQAVPTPVHVPQQPPPLPPAARTVPQRLGRLEEDVQGLRRNVGSLRGLMKRLMTNQGRFSTWMMTCMTQLMDASGLAYQAFDGTFRESSPLAFQRRTRQRTDGASTSAAHTVSLIYTSRVKNRSKREVGYQKVVLELSFERLDLEVMELENIQNSALAKLPMLKLGEYEMWEIRIKQYFQIQDYALWESLENGNSLGGTFSVTTHQNLVHHQQTKDNCAFYYEEKTSFVVKRMMPSRLCLVDWQLGVELLLQKILKKLRNLLGEAMMIKLAFVLLSCKAFTNNLILLTLKLSNIPQKGSQLVHEDLEQLHDDDLEEMDLQVEMMSLLSMRARKFYQRTRRKIIIDGSNTARYDKSRVECFNCHKIGHFARECSSTRMCVDLIGVTWLRRIQANMVSYGIRDSEATYKRGLATLEGQIVKYREHEVLFSEEIALLKRSVGSKEYQMGLLRLNLKRPTTLDLSYSGLEEFKEPEVDKDWKEKFFYPANHVREVEPKKVRENNDAPIIEDWVSDDEDDDEPNPKVEKKTVIPTATKKEFVKPEKPVKRSVRHVLSVEVLITFNTAVLTNRGKEYAHKHMAPRAVLMKTGLKSVNTARPVNTVRSVNTGRPFSTARSFNTVRPSYTAHPKSTIHCARPRTYFQNQAQSTVHRPFYKRTTLTKRCFNQRFNTGRPFRSTVNTVRERGFNAVKPLACWVWRPIKPNGASLVFNKYNYIDARGRSKSVMAWVPKENYFISFYCAEQFTTNDMALLIVKSRLCYHAWSLKTITEESFKKNSSWMNLVWYYFLPNPRILSSQLALMGYHTEDSKITSSPSHSPAPSHSPEPTPSHSPSPSPEPSPDPTTVAVSQPSPTQPSPRTEHHLPTPNKSPLHAVHSHESDEGRLKLNELTDLVTKLFDRIGVLEDDLKTTKQTYSSAFTKLILRVKKLEAQIKIRKARRRARIVHSDDEDIADDSSKQGRKLSDAEVQEKASNETEPVIQDVTPTEVIQDQESSKKGQSEVSTARAKQGTASEVLIVSTAEVNLNTAGGTVTYTRRSEEKRTRKDKGKAIMTESEPKKKSKKELEQEKLSFAEAIRLQEQMDEEQRAQIARDEEIARQWDEEEKQRAMSEAKTSKKIDWNDPSVIRYHALKMKPKTVAQARRNMVKYLKNQGNYKISDFKGMSYNEIRPIFEKVWDFNQHIEPMDLEHGSERMKSPEKIEEEDVDTQKEMKEVSKESGAKRKKSLPRKSTRSTVKRQKMELDDEKEDLKGYLDIVPREDVAEDVESLSTKYPIVDWKTYTLSENFMYYKIIRGDGSSKNYKILSEMLYDFDRQDIMELYRLVKERYSSSKPEGYDLMLWGDLHTLFEPDEESEIWKNQNEYNLISWSLCDLCGVHILLMQNRIAIHMLKEKKYSLSQEMISKMLSKRLEVDHESTQAYELLKFIRSQGRIVGNKSSSRVNTAKIKKAVRKGVLKLVLTGATKGTASEVPVEKSKWTEYEPKKKSKKEIEQEMLSFAEAIRLEEQRAQIARDEEIARQWDEEERQRAMSEAKSTKKIDWNDPSVIRELQDYWTSMEMKSPEKIEEKYVDAQKEIKEVVKESGAKRKKSLPRKRSTIKRQKMEINDEKEDLKVYLDIVPREDVAEDVESLSTKYPIVDWKTIHL